MQNPMSTEALVTWLEKQPAGGRYSYVCGDRCLMAQYLRAAGFTVCDVNPRSWRDYTTSHRLPKGWDWVARGSGRTYGQALERARRVADGYPGSYPLLFRMINWWMERKIAKAASAPT